MHTVRTNHTNGSRSLRFAAAALLALAASSSSFAQDATEAKPEAAKTDEDIITMDAFKVQGSFRGSLAAAAEAKQANQIAVEVIAAEDIGKLPDTSIADSLTRLPGLTSQRTNGRSQAISIRGLTGDFSTGLLNGLQQVTTNDNRAVEFDQYPAELLSGVVVYKTNAANLVGQGLAGTIDLHTVRPLSMHGRKVALSAYYDWTQYKQLTPGLKNSGEHAHLAYIDQFADNTVGLALGFAHTSTPFEGEQFQAWGYPTDPAGNLIMGGTKSYVRSSTLSRDAIMATLEFKPNANFHSVIDAYFTRFKENQLLRGMEIPLAFWSSASLQPGYTVTNGLVTQATLTNIQPVIRNDTFVRNDNLYSVDWTLEAFRKSDWPTTVQAGYSHVNRKDKNLETYSGLGWRQTPFGSTDTITLVERPGAIPTITTTVDYTNSSLFKITDPQGWGPGYVPGGGMVGYLKYFQSKDELGEIKISSKHAVGGIFPDVDFGLAYTDRYKQSGQNPTGFIYPAAGTSTSALPKIIGTTDMSYLGIKGIYAYDPNAAYDNGVYGFYPNTNLGSFVGDNFKVWEKLTTLYSQLNMKTKLGELPFGGNLGFQLIHTDQSSAGLSALSGTDTITHVNEGKKYFTFNPNLNLNLTITENTVLRLGLAREEARPRMYDMRASRNYSFNPSLATSTDLSHSPWGGSSGNPALRPWEADSINLSLEHYFKENSGYIALSAFDKKLLSYIYNQNTLSDFTGYNTGSSLTPALWQGITSSPVNGSGGNVRGVEATLQVSSELITGGSVKGFGLTVNGAYTDSTIQPWGPGNGTSSIAGLSRKVANFTVYYERAGFSARLSERYRSSTREYITTFGPPNPSGDATPNGGFSLAQPETVMDAQVSYEFQKGALKGVTIFLQGNNLTNEALVTFNNGDPRQVVNYQKYGSSYSAGVSYRF